MIDRKILTMKFRDFGINYQLKVNEDYINFIERELNLEGFNNDDFVYAIKTIIRDTPNTFGKMPNLGMFIEARKNRYTVTNNYGWMPKVEPAKQIKHHVTQQDIDNFIAHAKEKLKTVENPELRESCRQLGLATVARMKERVK